MANFRSVPHDIEAFQFTKGWVRPNWFQEAMKNGKATVTINSTDKHITIYGDNQTERAYLEDWVCLSVHGKIYKLDNQSFLSDYRAINENA